MEKLRIHPFVLVFAVLASAVLGGVGGAIANSGPTTGPSINIERAIFEECLYKSQSDAPAIDQPMVVRECRIAAAQMVGRLPRSQ
jgi:hypothetical protein